MVGEQRGEQLTSFEDWQPARPGFQHATRTVPFVPEISNLNLISVFFRSVRITHGRHLLCASTSTRRSPTDARNGCDGHARRRERRPCSELRAAHERQSPAVGAAGATSLLDYVHAANSYSCRPDFRLHQRGDRPRLGLRRDAVADRADAAALAPSQMTNSDAQACLADLFFRAARSRATVARVRARPAAQDA